MACARVNLAQETEEISNRVAELVWASTAPMALEDLKSIMTHLVEMQRQALEANEETVVVLAWRLEQPVPKTKRLQDHANAQALPDELKESIQPKPRKCFGDMKFMLNLSNLFQESRRTSTTERDT